VNVVIPPGRNAQLSPLCHRRAINGECVCTRQPQTTPKTRIQFSPRISLTCASV
jgi:hypothetical protein